MFNKLISLVIISIVVVFFPAQANVVMQWVLQFHAYTIDLLAAIFSDDHVGRLIRDLLGLFALPVLVGLVFAILYWVMRRRLFPFFAAFVWSIWLLQLGALLVLHKV